MTYKKTVLVLGSTGMLGHSVGRYFEEHSETYDTILSYRNENVSYGKSRVYFDACHGNFDDLPRCDYIINCIGTIKPFMGENVKNSIRINSVFPWLLADYCKQQNIKLIHITTDCVFSGHGSLYTEESLHDATDAYGKSKSLGEPTNCMVLRTSIIGEEVHKKASLIEWAKAQAWGEVNGYTNHYWNGISTKQYAKICDQIITSELYAEGLFHIFSPGSVTKYELLSLINDRFNLLIKINPFVADQSIDRTLSSKRELNSKLSIPDIQQQIEEI